MADMTPTPGYYRLPARYAYLAKALAASLTVESMRRCHGSWPTHPETTSKVTEGPGGMGPGGKPYDGNLALTLTNTWPFTIEPQDELVIGHIAATAYSAYLDGFEANEVERTELAMYAWKQPRHIWKELVGTEHKQDQAHGVDWWPRVEASSKRLRSTWDAARFYSDLPRIAAYQNLDLALTVEGSTETHDAFEMFMQCAGGDAWCKDAVYNRLFDVIIDKATEWAWKVGKVTNPVQDDEYRQALGMALTDIDATIRTFNNLDDPWAIGTEDSNIGSDQVLSLAKYIDVVHGMVGTAQMTVGGGGKESGAGKGKGDAGKGEGEGDGKGEDELPELVSAVLAQSDVSEAIASLQGQDPTPSNSQDAEATTGVAPGTQSALIKVTSLRPPTADEEGAADALAEVLSHFSSISRPGVKRNQEEGKVNALDWYVAQRNSPGAMNWRNQPVRDRRPQFSMALAVVCDTSGSMIYNRANPTAPQKPIQALSSALYVLTQGFRKAVRYGSPSRIWTGCFNTVWENVSVKPDVVSEFAADGGTEPFDCIEAAVAWLDDQPVAHRYLVVWTDDEWGGWENNDALQSKHVQHRIMFIPPGYTGDREMFEVHNVTNVNDMVAVLQTEVDKAFSAVASSLR
jgi:hypothetical protein